MKDFAKSIVCNTKAENIAADITTDGNTWFVTTSDGKKKEFPSEREAEEYVKKIKAGNKKVGNSRVGNKKIKGSYVTIDTSTGRVTFDDFAGKSFDISRIDSSAGFELRVMQQQINDFKKALEEAKSLAKQIGNSKVGNGITKFGLGKYVVADGYKAIVLGEKEERGPNGIPFGWVTIRWVEGPWKGQSDQYYDYDLKKTGNKKVGNANTHLTASNSGELWLNFDGTGEMYDPIELGRYDFSGKSEALSVARELEQLKRKAEQKVKDADKFINAIKQWAAGLK